ncbi:MAG: hypothetical protein V4638_07275 [Bacteroidota bacterium]
MKKICYTIVIILVSQMLFSQQISKENKELIDSIYNEMCAGKGISKQKRPELQIASESKVAAYYPESIKIKLDPSAFDICAKFGPRRNDAIAFVLSHELGHFEMNSFWSKDYNEYASLFEDSLNVLQKQNDESIKRLMENETQADIRAGIIRYLGGFSTLGFTRSVMDTLYASYSLPDKMKGYPLRDERIKIAEKNDHLIEEFIHIFETSNFAVLSEDFTEAIEGYEFLIKQGFESREIYNNLGFIYYLQASQMFESSTLFNEKKLKFIYPIELDLESKARGAGTKGGNDFDEKITKLLEKASESFETAINFDKKYSIAYLNLGCVASILGKYIQAEGYLATAKELAKREKDRPTRDNADLVLALIQYIKEGGDKKMTSKIVNRLAKAGHEYAILNQKLIAGKEYKDLSLIKPTPNQKFKRETIENLDLYNVSEIDATIFENVTDFKLNREPLSIYNFNNSVIYSYKVIVEKYSKIKLFHVTAENYTGSTQLGIKIGSTESDLKNAYGEPSKIFPVAQGWVYHYPNLKLMMVMNQNKMVTKWMVYYVM